MAELSGKAAATAAPLHTGLSAAPKPIEKKPAVDTAAGFLDDYLGWLMGLEPTTTGITILDSTN